MTRTILSIFLLTIASTALGQWTDLGDQGTHVQMIEDAVGYGFKNTPGPTPATGTTFAVRSTLNDWESNSVVSSGGGGTYGCCNISNMHFLNPAVGMYTSSFQGVYSFKRTTDSGNNWTSFASNLNFSPRDLIMVGDTVAYLSGNSYGTDHGKLYLLTPTAAIQLFEIDTLLFNYSKLEFVDPNTGFMIMNDTNAYSHLMRVTDLGANWEVAFSDTTSELTSISFPDELTGYVSSAGGSVFKTTDGGVNWSEMTSPTIYRINSVDFINDSTGYVACDTGEVYLTTDGALTWSSQPPGTLSDLIDIKMIDEHTVYCITEEGILLKLGGGSPMGMASNEDAWRPIVHPNPSSGLISVTLPDDHKAKNIEFYDNSGRLVLSTVQNRLDVSSLDSGIYHVRVETTNGRYVVKFVRE